MAQVTFRFAAFEPSLLHPAGLPDVSDSDDDSAPRIGSDATTGSDPVMHVERPAQDEVPRRVLRTRAFVVPDAPHRAFNAFSVVHDDVGHYDAYANPTNGEPNTNHDEEVRQWYVKPVRFFAYELNDQRGHVYATTPTAILKEMFRRYRATTQNERTTFRQRVVDIRALEPTLQLRMAAQTTGYTFRNVLSDTAITRIVADGQQFGDNDELQNVRDRAEKIGAIRFDFQHGDAILRIGIDEHATVRFSYNPGDRPALDILNQLDEHIAAHSDLTAVSVR